MINLMNIPWQSSKCILCCKNAELTTEHIIPDSLGGILTCKFLCTSCNSSLGKSFEAAVRSDPSVRIAIGNLGSEIPNLFQKLTNNQDYIGIGPGGTDRGVIRNGQFRIRSQKADDGSLIQPSDIARKTIKKILIKKGSEINATQDALRIFDEAPKNERIKIDEELEIIHWEIEKLDLDLSDSSVMSLLVPLKIAFEFLALHLGSSVYDDSPQIWDYRKALSGSIKEQECFRVDRFNATNFEPFHGICFEGNKPYAQVLIKLFGGLVFRVHFFQIMVEGPKFVYTHYLDSNREDFRMLKR